MVRLIVAALVVMMLCPLAVRAEQVLVLSGFDRSDVSRLVSRRLMAAYSELGIGLRFETSEALRALSDAASGGSDGEVARIALVGSRYPTLLRVDVPLLTLNLTGYAIAPEMKKLTDAELRDVQVGYVRGVKLAEAAVTGFANIWPADDVPQLFRMLSLGRIDVAIAGRRPAAAAIEALNLNGVYSLPALDASYPLYHYLHERHRDLVPRVEEVLKRQLQEDRDAPQTQ